jgi:alpha-tubulin suppressor-like RCC1 family protein
MAAPPSSSKAALLDLPVEVLADVCLQLDLHDLVRVAETCKRFRHGGLETLELPTESPVVTSLRKLAFPRPELVPSARPMGCSESWVVYLARCARQFRCREAPSIAAGRHSLFMDAAGRLLACGEGAAVGHGDANAVYSSPSPVVAIAGIRVRSVAAGHYHSLTLGWDGRVYSWGGNWCGQLGHGDTLARPSPTLVKELESVCSVAAAEAHSLAVTQSGAVFRWGCELQRLEDEEDGENMLRPVIVEGFGGARVRRVYAGGYVAFAISEDGELFSWGDGEFGLLGHGDDKEQASPRRVEALRGVRMSSVAVGLWHALALSDDGLVYAWGESEREWPLLGTPNVYIEPRPKPMEALRGVRVSSIAAAANCSYALADTGELWAWGSERDGNPPIGHNEQMDCHVPKPIELLRGIKVDAVAAAGLHTLARTDDGSVYTWGSKWAEKAGALGPGPSVSDEGEDVHTPQRIPGLRVACGL